MTTERWLRLIAGIMTLLSVTLTILVSKNWIWFTAFIGVNLLQSGFTNWCPMKSLLERFGTKSE
ncbi:MAG: DUF2892 domain-containing protein [Capsulimonadaceae bacterium]|nr:DUF2892 domain-containing protein [Capsulimonadaceae bacterium]